jgi:HAD superfamily hydrolase (TIGR01509 family)
VLVDSERLAVAIDVEMIRGLGWEITEQEVIERYVGRSTDHMWADIEAEIGRALPGGWGDDVQRRLRDAFEAELRPVDGVVEALDAIDIPTCVASSGSHEKMRFTLGLTGLRERFEGRIFSAEEVERGKPAPDLFLHAAERMGAAPAACAVVEDSRYGVEAARAAGMRALGYAGGVTAAPVLEAAGAEVFADMRELPGLL